MFPLGLALLPGEHLPLQIFEPRYLAMFEAGSDEFGVVLIARGHEVGGGDQRTDVGTLARIDRRVTLPGNRLGVLCTGLRRIRVQSWLADDPFPRAQVQDWPDEPSAAPPLDDLVERAAQAQELYVRLAARPVPPLDGLPDEPTARSFALAAAIPLGQTDRQRVLSAPSVARRAEVLAEAVDDVIAALRFQLEAP